MTPTDVPGLLHALAEAGDRAAARRAARDVLQEACVASGTSIEATAPEAVRELLRLLERHDTPWVTDVLGVLDATAFYLGEWEKQQQMSSQPGMYDAEVGWETAVAELLAPGLDIVRPSLTVRDPEARSMAAALVGDASVEWTADLDLLLAAEAAESHALARACQAEAAVTLALRAPAARLPGRVEPWLRDPEAVVRFRVARTARTAPAAEDAQLALLADGVYDADRGAMETVWPAEV
ncbi:hypothetical protein AB5J52_37300 [Streptomyces sp. R39]|uniref:HEAT repeat domain-containing protein n=1 Tax=Streptomyces sp. R39 TaxID=3238631 RepID=A0AB39QZA9_9ACTN